METDFRAGLTDLDRGKEKIKKERKGGTRGTDDDTEKDKKRCI
jgi:hypothetical protein